MKLAHLLPALAILPLLPLSSCKPSASSLRFIDLPAHHFEDCGDKMTAEAQAVVEHYLSTGDVNHASAEHGLTMLHLAAATHRLWLVEQLLAQGADPNPRLRQGDTKTAGDTPAMLAVRASNRLNRRDALLVVSALKQNGADINIPGYKGRALLTACDHEDYTSQGDMTGEELLLELMKRGARGDMQTSMACVGHAPLALDALLSSAEGEAIGKEMPVLLHYCIRSYAGRQQQLDCAKVLLKHASSVDVRNADMGQTPLFLLAEKFLPWATRLRVGVEDANWQNFATFFAALLSKGADPLAPSGEFLQTCAADLLVCNADMVRELKKRGFTITAPAHLFTEENLVYALQDIPTEAIRTEEAEAQFVLLASLIATPQERIDGGERQLHYRQACAKALTLLHRVDAAHTRAMLMAQPAWKDPSAWQGEAEAARGLLYALQQNPQVILPHKWLAECARTMERASQPQLAHAFILLLARDPSASATIDELCAESSPLPLRAAAWSCKLEQAGLPALGLAKQWDSSHGISGGYDILWRARHAAKSAQWVENDATLRRPERLFYEPAPETPYQPERDYQTQRCHQALRELGAPLASRLCGDTTSYGPPPSEELQAIAEQHGLAVAASLELELAVAQSVWENREGFQTKPQPRIRRSIYFK